LRKVSVIHPFLFAIFPVLFLFSYNKTRMSLGETVVPGAAVIVSATVLLYLLHAIVKERIKAGVIVSSFLVLFFSYGHFYSALAVVRHRYLLTLWAILFVLIVHWSWRTRRDLTNLTQFLNVVAISLVLISVIDIAWYKLRTDARWFRDEIVHDLDDLSPEIRDVGTLPDIYYVILDRYAGAETLMECYGFDNSEFLNYLTARGFYVASESKANYLKTAHSLASSLNMEYINYLTQTVGEASRDWRPLFSLLQDYKVWRFLKQRGYRFIHFGDGWHATSRNKYADANINYYWISEFAMLLYETTMFSPIGVQLGLLDKRREQWRRILYKLDKLEEIPYIEEPTFVFAHMLLPHAPYVFDRDGNFLTEQASLRRAEKRNYIDQLIFTNKRVMRLIDTLITNSEVPPIIILQSDEGPFPLRYRQDADHFNWEQATKAELNEKMRILNAYYLPGAPGDVLYPSVSPVNSFRIIFNLYFNQDFGTLPDKSYAFVDAQHLYRFFDVTDALK
jgi:hypothetical protein